MADVNRGNRPLSPFMLGQVYRFQITSVMSLLHRVTGVGISFGAVLGVWWFLAAASGPGYFAVVDGLLTSWIGGLVMLGMLVALWYHFCNGVRHLVWDAGYGFDLASVDRSGMIALVATGVLTILTLIVAW